jgi:hypothetical protein
MADANPPLPPPPPQAERPPFTQPDPIDPRQNEMTVVSHSNLFYWWPVWAISFILAVLTLFEGHTMVTVPPGKWEVAHQATVTLADGSKKEKQAVVYGDDPQKSNPNDESTRLQKPERYISKHKSYGVLFTFVLLLVIFITNVPLRGMWSLIVILVLAFIVLLLAFFSLWDRVFELLGDLDIRINAGGYLAIGITLLLMWLVTFLFFDRQVYITVTPGNFKVCTEIGGGEKVYDTAGMQLEKHRSDLFRHWILGMGSGDLTVHTSGAQSAHIDLPNVLFIGRKVEQIENMIKKKAVVQTG